MNEKEAHLDAAASDRKWSYLWYSGPLVSNPHKGESWVLLEVHKGLCEAAYQSLKDEGVDAQPHYSNPHISVLRPEECEQLEKRFGQKWRGAAKVGSTMRFRIEKMVSVIPRGWKEMDRVWFLECASPDLEKYRKSLGFTAIPRSPDDDEHHMRFHVTFAVRRSEVKRASEALTHTHDRAFALDEVFEKAAEDLVGIAPKPPRDTDGEKLRGVFDKMELDPEVTKSTLGQPHTTAGVPLLLRTTQKLLNLSKGTEEIDDRDSLAYQTVHSAEDFFGERIHKDAGQIGRKLLWKSTLRGDLKHIPVGALSPQIRSVLLRSGMGMPIEEINPMDVHDQRHRVLRLGEGGISSLEAVPDESRNVQPSHFGFLDPIRAPECHSQDSQVMTLTGWKDWPTITKADKLACQVEGRLEYHVPERLIAQPYKGLMYGAKTNFLDYLVTPQHRMWIRPQGHKQKKYTPIYRFETPDVVAQYNRIFLCGGHAAFTGGERTTFILPLVEAAGKENQVKGNPPIGASLKNVTQPIPMEDWAAFMGWYLAEGCCNGLYVTKISQLESANAENCKSISELLTRLPFAWSFDGKDFSICGKQLNSYLQQFGFCNDKFISPEIWEASVQAREAFLETLLSGDGRRDRHGDLRMLCTTSSRLALETQILAFQLGWSTRVSFEPDVRKDTYLGCHIVYLHRVNERHVTPKSQRHPDGQYYTQEYDGLVYCATVPGGLLYTRRGKGLGFWSGNSGKIGVDSRLSHGVVKGSDGQFYTEMTNARTGKPEMVSAAQAAKSTVAFPGEFERNGSHIRSMVKSHQVEYADRGDVDYVLPKFNNMFSATSNLVPMITGIKGGRLLMGAKYIVQALPLRGAEAPLVQNMHENGQSFDDHYGDQVGAVHAPQQGVVTNMDKNGITVRYADGQEKTHELYNNFPFNRKTFVHSTPVVKIGDQLKAGQLLATSNYTDKNGTLALGTNVRTAYVPFKGLNFEDAVVISESAAKKFSSEHMYQHQVEVDENSQLGRKQYISMFPAKFKRDQLGNIDDRGVVKIGSIVKPGDPLTLGLKRHVGDALHRSHKPIWSDSATTWDHHDEGEVTDVSATKEGGWNVTIKTYMPAQEGDKLAGRYGDKGVISRIIPDHQMLHDESGQPLDVLLNPQGINTRVNPAQVFEALLGKIARKKGEPYKLPAHLPADEWTNLVQGELDKHGMKSNETLHDPMTGNPIKDVLTGERFIMKLHHTAESKGRGRDVGAYTSEGLPARGGEFGAKRVSTMEQSALVSHGATEVLRDAQVVRGQRNDDFWSAFRRGYTPPAPKVPFIYQKMLGYMQGAGINIKKEGDTMHLFGMTDKDVDKLSSGAVAHPGTVNGDDMSEIKGGLFDRQLTGGHNGTRWSHVELHEPTPNPVMEEPIRQLLGLTQQGYEDVLSGKKDINGQFGGAAIKSALSKINVDNAIAHAESTIKTGAKSKRDAAVKSLGYLKTLQKHDLRPEDWIMSKVPVLPPSMRPITAFRGMTMSADPNYLYKDLMTANENLKDLKGELGDAGVGEERLQLYHAFKAVSGLGDPIQAKTQEKQVKGLLAHVFGQGSPKLGMFQRRVLGSPVDVVGRAAITPNPDYNMDQVGLPEAKAWTLYRPFIIRRLVRRGMPATEAVKAVVDQSDHARKAMLEEMDERPVLINRAPTLHRYGFLSSWPKLVKNETLQISPVVCAGFGADFDGDAMNYHVPVTDGAVKDAIEKMMPSRNLRSVRDFGVHYVPKNEFLMGLYLASQKDNKNEPRVFKDHHAALAAYHRGEVDLGDRIHVRDSK